MGEQFIYNNHKIYIITYMKFKDLLVLVLALNSFDIPLLVQVTKEPKRQLLTQLSQWVRKGLLVRLRRGMYTVAGPYRKAPFAIVSLANDLYRPSYLSGAWALSWYGLIPEKTVVFTSVTTRVPRTFQNSLGTFQYSHIKQAMFWGYSPYTIDGISVWIAAPEKSLLDYFHLHSGEWSIARLTEMRFQNLDSIDVKQLKTYAKKCGAPRLVRAVGNVCALVVQEGKGEPV